MAVNEIDESDCFDDVKRKEEQKLEGADCQAEESGESQLVVLDSSLRYEQALTMSAGKRVPRRWSSLDRTVASAGQW